MPRYRFTGDVSVVFCDLQTPDGSTWEPQPGDELDVDHEVAHPHLALVPEAPKSKPVAAEKAADAPEEE